MKLGTMFHAVSTIKRASVGAVKKIIFFESIGLKNSLVNSLMASAIG